MLQKFVDKWNEEHTEELPMTIAIMKTMIKESYDEWERDANPNKLPRYVKFGPHILLSHS